MRLSSQIRQIYKAVCFIEANLQEEVTVAQIADEAGYSLFHFCRQFSRITGFSPFHYLIKRRIHQSIYHLTNTNHNISRIAFDFCFNSPETYSRAFRRVIGDLPQKFRNQHHEIPENLLMPALTKNDLVFRNKSDFHLPEIVDIEKFQIQGLLGFFADKKLLLSELDTVEILYEIIEVSPISQKKYIFIGSTVFNSNNPLFVQKTLPSARWVKTAFQENEQQLLENFLNHTWLPASKLKVNSLRHMLISDRESKIFYLFLPLINLD